MPLIFGGDATEWGSDNSKILSSSKILEANLSKIPGVEAGVEAFLGSPVVPLAYNASDTSDTVCFLQREAVTIALPAAIRWLVSSEATTCLLAFALSSDRVFAAHIDGADAAASFFAGINTLSSRPWELYLVGSYSSCRASREVATSVLTLADTSGHHFKLRLACVFGMNTVVDGPLKKPRVTCAALDLTAMTVHPAAIDLDGPDVSQQLLPRHAAVNRDVAGLHWCWDQSTNQYIPNPTTGKWLIDRFTIFTLLNLNDAQLLQATSTSPEVEAPAFPQRMRAVLRFILQSMHDEAEAAKERELLASSSSSSSLSSFTFFSARGGSSGGGGNGSTSPSWGARAGPHTPADSQGDSASAAGSRSRSSSGQTPSAGTPTAAGSSSSSGAGTGMGATAGGQLPAATAMSLPMSLLTGMASWASGSLGYSGNGVSGSPPSSSPTSTAAATGSLGGRGASGTQPDRTAGNTPTAATSAHT